VGEVVAAVRVMFFSPFKQNPVGKYIEKRREPSHDNILTIDR